MSNKQDTARHPIIDALIRGCAKRTAEFAAQFAQRNQEVPADVKAITDTLQAVNFGCQQGRAQRVITALVKAKLKVDVTPILALNKHLKFPIGTMLVPVKESSTKHPLNQPLLVYNADRYGLNNSCQAVGGAFPFDYERAEEFRVATQDEIESFFDSAPDKQNLWSTLSQRAQFSTMLTEAIA